MVGMVSVARIGRMIQFCDVRKRFGDHVVLDGFTLDIPDGQTTVIIGASVYIAHRESVHQRSAALPPARPDAGPLPARTRLETRDAAE